ncbi:class C beta-lactamase [Burkholderia sp. S171]|uniref:class C beta-lactamase n=1 Tax=Burkholderia sp. S171 TaxID=1641860 RepID=UPI00265CF655|nr:class C beta-lactamase [Burkholderia sp. S171]
MASSTYGESNSTRKDISDVMDSVIRPLMQEYAIPGMAVAVIVNGESYFYNYGVTSLKTRQPVTNKTLFEIGSASKTFTATLASYAQVKGNLSLSDSASKYLPSLRGSSFDNVKLLNLGTHTAGGLPLQVPDAIRNDDQLMSYFRQWQPSYAAGTYRVYSNPSIGMLGMIAARSMNEPFDDAIEKKLFPMLGMTHSYINVPSDQMKDYAQGYTKQGAPIRLSAGALSSEAYGIKSSTTDMIRFIAANMRMVKIDSELQRAINDTHIGYFKAGEMTQDLIWEQYPYPVELKKLLAGNSDAMAYQATKVVEINPPLQPQANALINKTGSTNGFATYVAFVPGQKIGIVMLANKNYPVAQRVTAAHQVLTQLGGRLGPQD